MLPDVCKMCWNVRLAYSENPDALGGREWEFVSCKQRQVDIAEQAERNSTEHQVMSDAGAILRWTPTSGFSLLASYKLDDEELLNLRHLSTLRPPDSLLLAINQAVRTIALELAHKSLITTV